MDVDLVEQTSTLKSTTSGTSTTTTTVTTPVTSTERPKKRKRSVDVAGSSIQKSFVNQELQKIMTRYEELYSIFGEQLHPFLCAVSPSTSLATPKKPVDDEQSDLHTVRIEGTDYLLPMDEQDNILTRNELQMF